MSNIEALTVQQCCDEILKIRDKDVKNFLFNFSWDEDDFLRGASEIYTYFNNIIIITFMYLYGKYLSWIPKSEANYEKNSMLKTSSNFMRIITTFEKLYSSFDLSYELIENILSDIQIMFNSRNNSIYTKELGIEGDFATINDFSSCLQICRQGRSLRSQSADAGLLRKKLVDFLSMVPFITNIDIEHSPFVYGDKTLAIKNNKEENVHFERLNVRKMNTVGDNFEMNTSYVFIFDKDNYQYYYLASIEEKEFFTQEGDKKNYLVLSYNTVGVFSEASGKGKKIYLIIKDQNTNLTDIDIEKFYYLDAPIDLKSFRQMYFGIKEEASASHFIKDFNSINYRYIRVLSLAISDILNEDSKLKIYNTYSRRNEYKSMFVENANDSDDLLNNNGLEEKGYGWDVVIAVILIGESAKKFLFTLFEGHSNRYEELLTNLEYRFGKTVFNRDELIQQARDEMKNAKNKTFKEAYGNPDRARFRSESVDAKKIQAKIQASIVVNTLSKITFSNENDAKRFAFPLSIRSRKRIIEEITYLDVGSSEERVVALKSLVCQTLKTFYVFYRALFKYGEVKIDFEKHSLVRIFKQSEIDSISETAITKFKEEVEKASKELSKIKDDDVKSMVLKIKEFNKICSYPGQQGSYNELLHTLLGREYLIQYRGISVLETCFDKYESRDPDFDFRDLGNQVLKAIDYLKTGELDRKFKSYRDTIFPLVVFMDYTSKTRDGYDIYHCSLSSNNDLEFENDYRVISEFNYHVNTPYYCIPNIDRSNDDMKLWIEPILIDANIIQEADFGYKESEDE